MSASRPRWENKRRSRRQCATDLRIPGRISTRRVDHALPLPFFPMLRGQSVRPFLAPIVGARSDVSTVGLSPGRVPFGRRRLVPPDHASHSQTPRLSPGLVPHERRRLVPHEQRRLVPPLTAGLSPGLVPLGRRRLVPPGRVALSMIPDLSPGLVPHERRRLVPPLTIHKKRSKGHADT